MSHPIQTNLNTVHSLLRAMLGQNESLRLLQLMHMPSFGRGQTQQVTRAELAFAMNMLLFRDLLERVPEGKAYTLDAAAQGRKVFFDHGAVRTVDIPAAGGLPAGEAALTRILKPLGYQLNEVYPLPRLKMTGRAYVHADLPEDMPQFFVSELHVARFSPAFQASAARVLGSSVDPLDAGDMRLLEQLEQQQVLSLEQALTLMPALLRCFGRQHAIPTLADYEILLAESQEMAWIATEGNAFNHVTDRVADIETLSREQQQLGRSIKSRVEVAARGTVRQTAYRAAEVQRVFRTAQACVVRSVPGSFYEFIARDRVGERSAEYPQGKLDLGFDSGNATAIFKMTSVEQAAA